MGTQERPGLYLGLPVVIAKAKSLSSPVSVTHFTDGKTEAHRGHCPAQDHRACFLQTTTLLCERNKSILTQTFSDTGVFLFHAALFYWQFSLQTYPVFLLPSPNPSLIPSATWGQTVPERC